MDNYLGNIYGDTHHDGYDGSVFSVDGLCKTITHSVGGIADILELEKLGNVYGEHDGGSFAGNVWNADHISPALTTMGGGGRQPHIVETTDVADDTVLVIDDLYANREVRTYADYAPNLRAERAGLKVMEDKWTWDVNGQLCRIRIRKLTPRECWRLMDICDEDYDKASEVNSRTQLYRQAGNGIVVGCLESIFNCLKEQYLED